MNKDEALKAALRLIKHLREGFAATIGLPKIFPCEIELACIAASEQEDTPEPVYEYHHG